MTTNASASSPSVDTQHSLGLVVNGVLGRGQNAGVENSSSQCLHEHWVAKVPISSYKDAALLLGYPQDFHIFCLRKTDSGNRDNVMPEVVQETCCNCVHILIERKLHAGTPVR